MVDIVLFVGLLAVTILAEHYRQEVQDLERWIDEIIEILEEETEA